MAESQDEPVARASPVLEVARFVPLYPRWVNAVVRLALACALGMLVAVPSFFIAWARTPYASGAAQPLQQPVRFDHRHHTRDDGIDCRYCHVSVEHAANAGMPSSELCMGCHSQVWNRAPVLSLVRASWFDDEPIVWQRVFALPKYVFFNHAVHVRRQVDCATCHGDIDGMPQVYMPRALTMSFCLDCHRNPVQHMQGRALHVKLAPPTHCTGCHR